MGGYGLRQKTVISLLLIVTMFAAITISGCMSKSVEATPLRVTDIDIVPGNIKTSTVELKVTTYIKNTGDEAAGASKNTSLLLRAISTDKEFLTNQTETFVGKIPKGKTVNVTQVIWLPKKGGYDLQAKLFEDGEEKDTGYRTVYDLQSLPADSQNTGLRIDGIDFMVRKADEGKVVIQSDIYVTNFGAKPSQDYGLMVKATDIDSKLVADKQWSRTGIIAPDETAIRSINLSVPDRYNYVVDVLIWSNSTIVGQGNDYVQLNATTMLGDKERMASRGTNTGRFVTAAAAEESPAEALKVSGFANATSRPTEAAPGFCASLAVAAIALVAVMGRRKR